MQKALFFKLGFYESQNPLSERVIEDFLILNPVIGSIATQAPNISVRVGGLRNNSPDFNRWQCQSGANILTSFPDANTLVK